MHDSMMVTALTTVMLKEMPIEVTRTHKVFGHCDISVTLEAKRTVEPIA